MTGNIIRRLRNSLENNEGVTVMAYGLVAAATVAAISALTLGIATGLSAIF